VDSLFETLAKAILRFVAGEIETYARWISPSGTTTLTSSVTG
jgi:hypothetical protein